MTMLIAETGSKLAAADRVWITTALLHHENPSKNDFSLAEIRERGRQEGLVEEHVNTFYVHANQHCVANRQPNPGNYRMLFETAKGRRRLYREGDMAWAGRTGKMQPRREDIPPKYHSLLDWYQTWRRGSSNNSGGSAPKTVDPLLALRGSGRDLWKDEHADEYVRHLREGWE